MTNLDKLLHFDPLDAAEKITGVDLDSKEYGPGFDNPSAALGLLLVQQHAKAKERALHELNDTTFNNEYPRYRQIIEGFGFEEVLRDPWSSVWGSTETLFIFAHRKGLLLKFDTFHGGKSVNSATVWYNWRPAAGDEDWWECRSSGHLNRADEKTWVGDHDAREALIHNLNKLNNRGEFVCPWIERPFLWLLNFDEPKAEGYDYDAINEARIERLPQWVRDFIGAA